MSLRWDLMVLVHFFNQSLWWFSSTLGLTRSRGGRSRCAWWLHWLWSFRWGRTAFGNGRNNSFSGLIGCDFDGAGLSHPRTDRTATLPAYHFCPDRWSRARTLSPTVTSLYLANLSWFDFILPCWLATRNPLSGVTTDSRVRSSKWQRPLCVLMVTNCWLSGSKWSCW